MRPDRRRAKGDTSYVLGKGEGKGPNTCRWLSSVPNVLSSPCNFSCLSDIAFYSAVTVMTLASLYVSRHATIRAFAGRHWKCQCHKTGKINRWNSESWNFLLIGSHRPLWLTNAPSYSSDTKNFIRFAETIIARNWSVSITELGINSKPNQSAHCCTEFHSDDFDPSVHENSQASRPHKTYVYGIRCPNDWGTITAFGDVASWWVLKLQSSLQRWTEIRDEHRRSILQSIRNDIVYFGF